MLVSDSSPRETDETNNSRTRDRRRDGARARTFTPARRRPRRLRDAVQPTRLRPGHAGAAGNAPDLEAKVKALEPQLVRIFYNESGKKRRPRTTWPPSSRRFSSLRSRARRSTSRTRPRPQRGCSPALFMGRFAAVLEDLVEMRGLTNVRWVTLQNEPNTPAFRSRQTSTTPCTARSTRSSLRAASAPRSG